MSAPSPSGLSVELLLRVIDVKYGYFTLLFIHGNKPWAVSVQGKRLQTKTSLPVGKRYLPMGKRASVTTGDKHEITIRKFLTKTCACDSGSFIRYNNFRNFPPDTLYVYCMT